MPKKEIVKEDKDKNEELNKYQKKSDREHILDNPDTYIGSVEFVESKIWIIYVIFGVVLFFQHVLDITLLKMLFDNSLMN